PRRVLPMNADKRRSIKWPHPRRPYGRGVGLEDTADETPSASTSKSSSLHCPEGRLAEARFRSAARTGAVLARPRVTDQQHEQWPVPVTLCAARGLVVAPTVAVR